MSRLRRPISLSSVWTYSSSWTRENDDAQTGPRRRAGGTGGPQQRAVRRARGRGEGPTQENTDESRTPARAFGRAAADAGGIWRQPYLQRPALARLRRELVGRGTVAPTGAGGVVRN